MKDIIKCLKLLNEFDTQLITIKKDIERLPKETDSKKESLPSDYFSWSGFKKRYPMTFWPQLLLEEFIAGASVRQKKRMRDAIKEMDKKNEIYKRIDKALRESGKN